VQVALGGCDRAGWRDASKAHHSSDQVLVSFEVVDGYNSDVRDAIASGLRTTFSYQVELRTVARMWLDRTIATAVVGTSDRHDNLTRRHTRADGRRPHRDVRCH
jgi:hypothetical protein